VEACDLVVRGKGVDPRTELARGFDFDVDSGIPTDAELRTPLPDVWAVGDAALTFDVAHRRQRVNAIWPMAVEQGTVAGRNMAGARQTYEGSLAMNSVRVGELHVVSAGVTRPPDGSYEVRTRGDGSRPGYRKIVLQDGILVGAIFAGGADQAGLAVSAIRQGARLDELPYDPLDERIHWGRYAFAAGCAGHPPDPGPEGSCRSAGTAEGAGEQKAG
jgi:NAD(P)H-nitrite reductase large subunit